MARAAATVRQPHPDRLREADRRKPGYRVITVSLYTPEAEWIDHMTQMLQRAGNPIGRRVIVAITGVTRNFDCRNAPSNKTAAQAVYESGAVVSAIVPKTPEQKMENGMMTWATRSLPHLLAA